MDNKELLEVLKNEMLLAKARAEGTREAYERKAVDIAWDDCKFRHNDKIFIKFSDGDKFAFFDKIKWSEYSFIDYEGPALYGWFALKNGTKSKTYGAICTIDMVRSGHVKIANA